MFSGCASVARSQSERGGRRRGADRASSSKKTAMTKDPERRCKPPSEWPADHRQLWEAALAPGDLLDEGGCRADHRDISNRAVEHGYGRWRTWVDRRGLLVHERRPGDL